MFDPVKASQNIKDEFIDYIETQFPISNAFYRDQFHEELSRIIDKGPYLEINDVFTTGKSINELIDEGVLSTSFRDLESNKPASEKRIFPLDRPLYWHQEEAVRRIVNGENLVVSTGTGSGKTNCFLLPVLNELMLEESEGTLGTGIRAIFIYPMNALANDQIKNIRRILSEYPSITFGVYNGSTEEEEEKAISTYEAMFANEPNLKLRSPLPNEMISREKMKEHPPHILFTNYAMLEHLLFRPKDDVLFSGNNFRFVVLDEAHVYCGATGIETSILLRRLKARISSRKKLQFILTSATLGDAKKDKEVAEFATNLTGASFSRNSVVRARREAYSPPIHPKTYPEHLLIELDDEQNNVKEVFKKYDIEIDESKSEEELIYDFIEGSFLYAGLRSMGDNIIPLNEIFEYLGVSEKTVIAFVSLCAKAEKGGRTLVDARYHYFLRGLEGCFISLGKEPRLFLQRRESYKGDAVFEVAICDDCGSLALVGKELDGHLVQANRYKDEEEYFFLASEDCEEDEEVKKKKQHYYLCPECGKIDRRKFQCEHDENNLIELIKANKPKDSSSPNTKCGRCGVGEYRRFYLGYDAATSVIGTALYEELPELEFSPETQKSSSENIFLKSLPGTSKKQGRKKARQFLVFSDSRQQAAKFACYMEKNYQEFLRRRGIVHMLKEKAPDILKGGFTLADLAYSLGNYFCDRRCFAENNNDRANLTDVSMNQAWVAVLNEVARYNAATSLTKLGMVQFHYLGNDERMASVLVDRYHISEEEAEQFLDFLIFDGFVNHGAIVAIDGINLNNDDLEYIFYSPNQKYVAKEHSGPSCSQWMPKAKRSGDGYNDMLKRLHCTKEILHINDEEAYEFLDQYFDYLKNESNPHPIVSKLKDGSFALCGKDIEVRLPSDSRAKWYRCQKCGAISQFHNGGKCLSRGCGGEIEQIDPVLLNNNNHFAKLYKSENFSPLYIKEHTAQLSKIEGLEYQEAFIKKDINALSCSTTFEMGVDVGDLETVFLRDVPPLPSNYAQRAGRAGRSLKTAAYSLTYAKLSSHDLTFFAAPKEMIGGQILPPQFKLDNEKIVRRHIYAVALAMYFGLYPEQYCNNRTLKFLGDKGYLNFIEWLESKPEKLQKMLLDSIPDVDGLHKRMGLLDYSWLDDFIGKDGILTNLIKEYEGNIEKYEALIKESTDEKDLDRASKYQRREKAYKNNRLIEFLARGNILPRYGFPVDTVELEQMRGTRELSLSRDMQMAIAEYAPSAEVIANGKMYTSRYIKKETIINDGGKKEWTIGYIAKCDHVDENGNQCDAINFSETPISDKGIECYACGHVLAKDKFTESIWPRSGFVTDGTEKGVPMTSQNKIYRSEFYYIGNKAARKINGFHYKLNDIVVTLESTTNDSLLVKSEKKFYVCPECGFAYAEDETISGDSQATKSMGNRAISIDTKGIHKNLYGSNCSCQHLNAFGLHHTFYTDVAKISFDCDTSSHKTMISVLYAILHAFSETLHIERRDIDAVLSFKIKDGLRSNSIILYDRVPGGAGHSRRLVTKDGKMLQLIIKKAYDKVHDCDCDPSCYKCLRSYENQMIHDDLDRKEAERFLAKLLGKVEPID